MNSYRFSELLSEHYATQPPSLLFHYTGQDALIGILKCKELWASNIRFLNDYKELLEAAEVAKRAIQSLVSRYGRQSRESEILQQMAEHAGTAAARYYVCSLSEHQDSLPQWRSYAPRTGGYSIGFPSGHLGALCEESGWRLVKCIYDDSLKHSVLRQIAESFVMDCVRRDVGGHPEERAKKFGWEFGQELCRIGGVFKHRSFREEAEWRLISPLVNESDLRVDFRPGPGNVVPFYRIPLVTERAPNLAVYEDVPLTVCVGPTPHISDAQMGVQFLMTRYLGRSCHGRSEVPFRAW